MTRRHAVEPGRVPTQILSAAKDYLAFLKGGSDGD